MFGDQEVWCRCENVMIIFWILMPPFSPVIHKLLFKWLLDFWVSLIYSGVEYYVVFSRNWRLKRFSLLLSNIIFFFFFFFLTTLFSTITLLNKFLSHFFVLFLENLIILRIFYLSLIRIALAAFFSLPGNWIFFHCEDFFKIKNE